MSDAGILHLVPAPEFRALTDSAPYLPRQFSADGFVHRDAIVEIRVARRAEDGTFLEV